MKHEKHERKEIAASIAIFAATALVLFPFARWYAFAGAVVAAYNFATLSWEIRDENVDRRTLAWIAVARTAIVVLVSALSVALEHKR